VKDGDGLLPLTACNAGTDKLTFPEASHSGLIGVPASLHAAQTLVPLIETSAVSLDGDMLERRQLCALTFVKGRDRCIGDCSVRHLRTCPLCQPMQLFGNRHALLRLGPARLSEPLPYSEDMNLHKVNIVGAALHSGL